MFDATPRGHSAVASCWQLPNGNIQIGVHIADVTHFLKSGSKLDEEAQERVCMLVALYL